MGTIVGVILLESQKDSGIHEWSKDDTYGRSEPFPDARGKVVRRTTRREQTPHLKPQTFVNPSSDEVGACPSWRPLQTTVAGPTWVPSCVA